MKYAMIGNPNCGKTTLFNALTGLKQKVGNWSGVTVDKKTGIIEFANQTIEIVDLPGIYTLTASDVSSIDEQIAARFIVEEKPDAIINVIDASNFERNLYLTTQLIETGIPLILAVNMIDVAGKKGIVIDCQKLQYILGCTVIPVIGRKKVGLDILKKELFKPQYSSNYDLTVYYPREIIALNTEISKRNYGNYPSLWLSTSIVDGNYLLQNLIAANVLEDIQSLKSKFVFDHMPDIKLSSARYQAIAELVQKCTKIQHITQHKATEVIDKLCMNKYLGIPVFLFVMYLMFEFSITIGGALQPLFDNTSSVIFVDGMTHLGVYLELPLWLVAVIAQGVGVGINTVLTFVPQIGCMFLFLSFLEDSGYMARAAYVMDRFMQAIGLPGKAFVPLIVGFGCNVPSVMATRTLETRRDRLMTIMMVPFMSCGARLAIFAVFAAAFFPQNSALIVFSLYIAGIIGAIITGYVVKFALTDKSAPFVMELPVYHLPNIKTIGLNSWGRLKRFIFRAGKVIVPICVLVGTLNSIETNGTVVAGGSPQSLLAEAGRSITPIFKPMGVSQDNWQATVGLLTGTLAKEVVVGTLNTLYTQDKPQSLADTVNEKFEFWRDLAASWYDTIDSLRNLSIGAFINPFAANEADTKMDKTAMGSMVIAFGSLAAAFAYMLFVLLYVPCASVIGATAREATRGWAWMSVIWSTSVAYAAAVIVYQFAQLTTTPLYAASWIITMLIYMTLLVLAMKYFSHKFRFEIELKKACNKGCAPMLSKESNCH